MAATAGIVSAQAYLPKNDEDHYDDGRGGTGRIGRSLSSSSDAHGRQGHASPDPGTYSQRAANDPSFFGIRTHNIDRLRARRAQEHGHKQGLCYTEPKRRGEGGRRGSVDDSVLSVHSSGSGYGQSRAASMVDLQGAGEDDNVFKPLSQQTKQNSFSTGDVDQIDGAKAQVRPPVTRHPSV